MCPCDGVKLGNVDAVFIKLEREVTAESYNEDAMLDLPALNKQCRTTKHTILFPKILAAEGAM